MTNIRNGEISDRKWLVYLNMLTKYIVFVVNCSGLLLQVT